MPRIEINKEKCKGCKLCVLYCGKQCIKVGTSINKKGLNPVIFVDKDKKCTGCSFCALMCPDGCIVIKK